MRREVAPGRLAHSLSKNHPGAASSLREGLEETLTLIWSRESREALYRTFQTTNPIENLNGSDCPVHAKRQTLGATGEMVLRWIAHSLNEATRGFRAGGVPRHEASGDALARRVEARTALVEAA